LQLAISNKSTLAAQTCKAPGCSEMHNHTMHTSGVAVRLSLGGHCKPAHYSSTAPAMPPPPLPPKNHPLFKLLLSLFLLHGATLSVTVFNTWHAGPPSCVAHQMIALS
jgi:hypothetical protein